jgi:hypothetical protein
MNSTLSGSRQTLFPYLSFVPTGACTMEPRLRTRHKGLGRLGKDKSGLDE